MGTSKKGAMAKDTVIYMLAKGIEGVVGVVTMSVMTYLFATFQMGLYSTVNIAITTIGMVAIQWLVQSVLRYVNKYDILNQQKEFYSTVFSAWKRVNVGVAITSETAATPTVAGTAKRRYILTASLISLAVASLSPSAQVRSIVG